MQYRQLEYNGQMWGSQNSQSERFSFILAAWCGKEGQVKANSTVLRPALIYFKHYILLSTQASAKPHVFASVIKWDMPHLNKNLLGEPVEVSCASLIEMTGPSQFIPLNQIHSQFIAGYYIHQGEKVLYVCPTSSKCFV